MGGALSQPLGPGGNSLAVQWLGLGAFTAGVRVQSLVEELRSRKPCGAAKPTNQPTNHWAPVKARQGLLPPLHGTRRLSPPCWPP